MGNERPIESEQDKLPRLDASIEVENEMTTISPPTTYYVDEEVTTTKLFEGDDFSEKPTTTVTVLSVNEEHDTTVITTTTKPSAVQDISTELPITLNEVDVDNNEPSKEVGVHEFDCKEIDQSRVNAHESQLPLECILRDGDEFKRTVYIVIDKEGVDTKRLLDKNIKVIVKDLIFMDISPK